MRRSFSSISTSTSSSSHGATVDARERGLAAVGLVERRQAHQPVDALLGLDDAVRVVALERERGRLDARLLARRRLDQLGLVAAVLGPAQVHAQQHLGPVLGVGAAGAGRDLHERGAAVVLAGEERGLLERVDLARGRAGRSRRARSPSRSSSAASSTIVGRSSSSADRRSNSSSSRASFARSALTLPAARASSQKPGAEMASSSSAMRVRSASGSKVITDPDEPGPQLLDGSRKILGFLNGCGSVGHGKEGSEGPKYPVRSARTRDRPRLRGQTPESAFSGSDPRTFPHASARNGSRCAGLSREDARKSA